MVDDFINLKRVNVIIKNQTYCVSCVSDNSYIQLCISTKKAFIKETIINLWRIVNRKSVRNLQIKQSEV